MDQDRRYIAASVPKTRECLPQGTWSQTSTAWRRGLGGKRSAYQQRWSAELDCMLTSFWMNAQFALRQMFTAVRTVFGKGWGTYAEMMFVVHLQALAERVLEILLMDYQTSCPAEITHQPVVSLSTDSPNVPWATPQNEQENYFQKNAGNDGRKECHVWLLRGLMRLCSRCGFCLTARAIVFQTRGLINIEGERCYWLSIMQAIEQPEERRSNTGHSMSTINVKSLSRTITIHDKSSFRS